MSPPEVTLFVQCTDNNSTYLRTHTYHTQTPFAALLLSGAWNND